MRMQHLVDCCREACCEDGLGGTPLPFWLFKRRDSQLSAPCDAVGGWDVDGAAGVPGIVHGVDQLPSAHEGPERLPDFRDEIEVGEVIARPIAQRTTRPLSWKSASFRQPAGLALGPAADRQGVVDIVGCRIVDVDAVAVYAIIQSVLAKKTNEIRRRNAVGRARDGRVSRWAGQVGVVDAPDEMTGVVRFKGETSPLTAFAAPRIDS